MSTEHREFTGYITKYSLTQGIQQKTLRTSDEKYATEVNSGIFGFFGRIGRDCFETHEAALHYAESRRKAKISSLKKQIAKLEKLTFA